MSKTVETLIAGAILALAGATLVGMLMSNGNPPPAATAPVKKK